VEEARSWAREIAALSPSALKFLKQAFNADTDHQAGLSAIAASGLDLFVETEEAKEGAQAFVEKRPPRFNRDAQEAEQA